MLFFEHFKKYENKGGMIIMKSKISKIIVLTLVCAMFVCGTVNAADYKSFPYTFNYAPGAPSSVNHVTQTVEVQSNASANAYAKCNSYSYTGNQPVLTIKSASSTYPTNSVSFTGVYTSGKPMKYTTSIPVANKSVKFTGTVTNYTSFTISASVKG